MAKLVSKIYGEALFELGMEEQCLEQLAEEAFAVQEAIRENPDLLKLAPVLLSKLFRAYEAQR